MDRAAPAALAGAAAGRWTGHLRMPTCRWRRKQSRTACGCSFPAEYRPTVCSGDCLSSGRWQVDETGAMAIGSQARRRLRPHGIRRCRHMNGERLSIWRCSDRVQKGRGRSTGGYYQQQFERSRSEKHSVRCSATKVRTARTREAGNSSAWDARRSAEPQDLRHSM